MSVKSFVVDALKSIRNHTFGFLKFTLYMGGPFIILYVLGDLIWLVNAKYGSIIFLILVIYLYIGVTQHKVEKSEFKNNQINVRLMLRLWKKVVIWPLIIGKK